MKPKSLIIIGGGAAGVFAAVCAKNVSITLIEKSGSLLSKVRVSGKGRCNLTHFTKDLKELCKNYPRGEKELLGCFHRFSPMDTIEWFESHGVLLKMEEDGRVFPKSDRSDTIIECLQNELKRKSVNLLKNQEILSIEKKDRFYVTLKDKTLSSDYLLLATGSAKEGFDFAKAFGHTIEKPIPSLFSFNILNSPFIDLSGTSADDVLVSIKDTPWNMKGTILFTHFGLSGPAIINLSAFGAKYLYEHNYKAKIVIQFVYGSFESVYKGFLEEKTAFPKSSLKNERFTQNLWKKLLELSNISFKQPLSDISHSKLKKLAKILTCFSLEMEGNAPNKEFVTCGGVSLKEVNCKTMESKMIKGLFFAGEILDIDGITGGYNLQNAWTTATLVSSAISSG